MRGFSIEEKDKAIEFLKKAYKIPAQPARLMLRPYRPEGEGRRCGVRMEDRRRNV